MVKIIIATQEPWHETVEILLKLIYLENRRGTTGQEKKKKLT